MASKNQMGKGGAPSVFNSYIPSSHDIFISTFAKSGTNWMMQIAHQVSFHGTGDYEHIHDVIPWPDLYKRIRDRISIPLADSLVQKASPERMRAIKTHLSADHVPYSEKAHYLIVLRDPKEIFVSSYFFSMGSYGPLMPDLNTWLDLFLTKEFPMNFGSSWAEHTASYWALKDQPNVLILTYTEMKKDLTACIQKVADSLNVTLTAAELMEVVKRSSFDYMKNIDYKFNPIPEGVMPWGEGFKLMRQGSIGNSTELISLEQQIRIDEHCQNELKSLGSDFPYSDIFSISST